MNDVGIQLLSNRVLIKRDKMPEKVGLLWIPDIARRLENQGVVVAMGPGLRKKKIGTFFPMPDVATGSRVAFQKNAGYDVVIDDVEYVIMRDEDIIGAVEETAA